MGKDASPSKFMEVTEPRISRGASDQIKSAAEDAFLKIVSPSSYLYIQPNQSTLQLPYIKEPSRDINHKNPKIFEHTRSIMENRAKSLTHSCYSAFTNHLSTFKLYTHKQLQILKALYNLTGNDMQSPGSVIKMLNLT